MTEGMELEEFVRATLLSVVRGVVEAQSDEGVGGYIGRAASTSSKDETENVVTQVSFDLATTAEEKRSAGGGFGIKVIPFASAEADGRVSGVQSTVSRIAFQVPVGVPRPSAQRAEDLARERERRASNERASAAMRDFGQRLGGWA